MRLDQLLVTRGLAASRERAKTLILDGKVQDGQGRSLSKPGLDLAEDTDIRLTEADIPWVSRGALKLLAALEGFGLDPAGAVCLDIGASTGGFTEVLLHHGAAKVYAVDVGHDQLAASLRDDPRVISREGVNARSLSAAEIPEAPDWIVCDASFISLELVLPAALTLAKPGAVLVCLIKPQFEVGRAAIGKKGVVRDAGAHEAAVEKIRSFLTQQGWPVRGVQDSPILGPEGNREFLAWAVRTA